MLKISLLGLFVEEQTFVKELLNKELSDYQISWVPPKSGEVHLLIVNANFLDSHSLINFLRSLPNTTSVYSVGTTEKGFDNSLKLNIPSLIFPIQKQARLEAWIEGIKTSVENRNVGSDDNGDISHVERKPSFDLTQLLDNILHQQIVMEATLESGALFYIDSVNNRLRYDEQSLGDQSFTLDDLTFNRIDDARAEELADLADEINLEAWLWNLCWHYPLDISYAANDQFVLKRWPTFLQSIQKDRSLVISVTALLQSGPQTYEGLLGHPRANPEIVTHYLYLMDLFNYIERSSQRSSPSKGSKERGEQKGIRSFIGKLREAIGI